MSEKLQKVLANAGYGSRREIEQWIKDERIKINGRLATLGDRITLDAKIQIDDKPPIKLSDKTPETQRVLIYHKPEGEVCSRSDPEGRKTVFQNLPKIKQGRWINIGRLDINTTGLLLFTNDGELANQLTHPSGQIEREYAVRVLGEVTRDMIKNLTKGVMLDDGIAKFDSVRDGGGQGANHWFTVVLREGRNREVRRLWESQGVKVSRLMRARFGNVTLPRRIRPGKWEEMEEKDIQLLKECLKGQGPTSRKPDKKNKKR
ncbi:MAG: pseudouridine synthase [Gammaproteobacteria bacterium]|nr:pseudouridine synthase [Gammaproteobacteria bacterium]MDH5593037.1 pseudouridine synthase [Gammaproteobacteria bacterium]MDH5613860.1 pseudouridine synthase [Gammaproteobacteria bacterium]